MEIRALVAESRKELHLMTPVIFVAPWSQIKDICEIVSPDRAASPNSIEYLCEHLPRSRFEPIILRKVMQSIDQFNGGKLW